MDEKDIQTVDITWFPQKQSLAEIYSSGMQYSFVNAQGQQCDPFFTCKDFLSDIVWATIHGRSTGIYGMSYDPATHPALDMENTRLLLTNSQDKNFLGKIEGLLDFINQVEDVFDFRNTTIRLVKDPAAKYKTCGIIETCSSHRWIRSPALLSLYTLFLRVGFTHTKGNNWQDTVKGMIAGKIEQYQHNDQSYLKSSIRGIEYIIKAGYKNVFFVQPKFNYPEKKDVSTIHNSSGIVAFSSSLNGKTLVKHWGRPEVRELEAKSEIKLSLK